MAGFPELAKAGDLGRDDVIMLLADWFLPSVYNIGFEGFQAGVLVWLFLGGLVALENFREQGAGVRSPTGRLCAQESDGRRHKGSRNER